jgi:uncharacterized repeat protein (TIGR04042 family)
MPEMRFTVRWPDGVAEDCYSPSLVVKDHLGVGETYALGEFRDRAQAALRTASERVAAKYGFPCRLALGQLARIEAACDRFSDTPDAAVTVEAFRE